MQLFNILDNVFFLMERFDVVFQTVLCSWFFVEEKEQIYCYKTIYPNLMEQFDVVF
jgi:hypothetical protein